MKKIEVMAKTVDSAIEKGLAELGIALEEADIQVLSEGGFLKQCKVIVSKRKTAGERAADFLEGLLEKMKLDYIVEAKEDDSEINIEIIGIDSGNIIGYRGEVLDAMQYLASLVANKNTATYKRIVLDTEAYRAKRISTLEQLAKNLESKVMRTKRATKLEPMNSFERRIIHAALHESENVETVSEGTEPLRYVVISPKRAQKDSAAAPRGKKEMKFVYRSDKKKRR